MKELTIKEIEDLLGYKVKIVADKAYRRLFSVPVGETFKVGDLEFIVLKHDYQGANVILKDYWKTDIFDSETNNYAHSKIRRDLNINFYNKLASLIGKENILSHTVDLTSDDGRKDYNKVLDNISLLTCNQYRDYVTILDKYNLQEWWWLATPYSTKSNGNSSLVRCATDFGTLNYDSYDFICGVRPFCILNSSIEVIT